MAPDLCNGRIAEKKIELEIKAMTHKKMVLWPEQKP